MENKWINEVKFVRGNDLTFRRLWVNRIGEVDWLLWADLMEYIGEPKMANRWKSRAYGPWKDHYRNIDGVKHVTKIVAWQIIEDKLDKMAMSSFVHRDKEYVFPTQEEWAVMCRLFNPIVLYQVAHIYEENGWKIPPFVLPSYITANKQNEKGGSHE